MNPETLKSLDRALDRLERRQRRSGRRLTTAPFMLAAGLGLGLVLLTTLVPQVWPSLLGSDPAEVLRGWPLRVWRLAEFCQDRQPAIVAAIATLSILTLLLSYSLRLLRPVVWAAALLVVFADAGIVVSTILACLQAAQGGG
jgi:hypothetical protein